MSITAMAVGRLVVDPELRHASNGNPYILAKIADDDSLVNVIAFGDLAEQMLSLRQGDRAAICGRASVRTWTGKDGRFKAGINLLADSLLSPVSSFRQSAAHRPPQPPEGPAVALQQAGEPLPWNEHWSALDPAFEHEREAAYAGLATPAQADDAARSHHGQTACDALDFGAPATAELKGDS